MSEPLLHPLQPRLRTRIWLALAQVAQHADHAPSLFRQSGQAIQLGEGYCVSYRVDAGTRTVVLTAVDQLAQATEAVFSS